MSLNNKDKKSIEKIIEKKLDAYFKKAPQTSKMPENEHSKKNISLGSYNSKIMSMRDDIYKTAMLSNPLTGLLYYTGMDKAIGKTARDSIGMLKKAMSNLFETKKTTSSTNKLLPIKKNYEVAKIPKKDNANYINTKLSTLHNGTNYIAAKQAIFLGGKNFINIVGGMGSSGIFSQKQAITDNTEDKSIKLLPNRKKEKSDLVEMAKGIDGIYKSTKEATKLLGIINKKAVLISSLTLLGVAGIIGLATWIKTKLGFDTRKNINKNKNMVDKLVTTNAGNLNLSTSINTQAQKIETFKGNLGDYTKRLDYKIGKTDYSKMADFKNAPKYSINTEENTPIKAPWECVISQIFIDEETVSVTYKGYCYTNKKGAPFVIAGLNPPPARAIGEHVKKGEYLGTAPKGKIDIITGVGDEYIQDYIEMSNLETAQGNEFAVNSWKNTPQKIQDKRSKAIDKSIKNASWWQGYWENADKLKTKVSEKVPFIKDGAQNLDKDGAATRTVAPIQLSTDVNKANKNEQKALSNSNKISSPTENRKPTKEMESRNIPNIQLPQNLGKDNIKFGIQNYADLNIASNNKLIGK